MRGFVFTLKPVRRKAQRNFIRGFSDVSSVLRRYGTVIYFTFIFALGTLAGSIYAGRAGESFLQKLDFLFTTNLEERLNQPIFSTFSASFASDFIFLLFVFLCALAPWGALVLFIAPAFKGFGTGLSAGYLFITYGFKGIGFYLLVILGGTFLFSFALIIQCVQSHFLSCKIAKSVFKGADSEYPLPFFLRNFLFRSLYSLVLTAAAAILDMLLWTAFSGMFFK